MRSNRRFPYSGTEVVGMWAAGLVLGYTLGIATPRSADPVATFPPGVVVSGPPSEGPRSSSPTASRPVPGSPSPDPMPSATAAAGESRSGLASWYGAAGRVAAVPGWNGVPYTARVCSGDRCVTVRVSDRCGCYVGTARERIIDLSDDAFGELADLSVGLIPVTVEAIP